MLIGKIKLYHWNIGRWNVENCQLTIKLSQSTVNGMGLVTKLCEPILIIFPFGALGRLGHRAIAGIGIYTGCTCFIFSSDSPASEVQHPHLLPEVRRLLVQHQFAEQQLRDDQLLVDQSFDSRPLIDRSLVDPVLVDQGRAPVDPAAAQWQGGWTCPGHEPGRGLDLPPQKCQELPVSNNWAVFFCLKLTLS